MSFKSERYLIEAIEQCQLNKITNLVQNGRNIHMKNTVGQNFLVYILKQQRQDSLLTKKRFQLFRFLITNHNLDIHTLDFYGKNVFNWATNLNCTKEALYLLNSYPGDIDILIRDQSGSCALHYAIEHGNEILVHAIVNYLARYRLRFDIKDAHNNTPEDLAEKLGYDQISHFLAQASRSTVFMAREIPFQQQSQMTNKSKATTNTNSSTTVSSLLDSSEYFNTIETRIDAAKSVGNWKTVVALRASKRNINEKTSNKILNPVPQTNIRASPMPPTRLPSINNAPQSSGQSEQMLRLIELELTSSFRRSFIPTYPRLINPSVSFLRMTNLQRKLSQASSRGMSSGLGHRTRDSDSSQMGISAFSLPPVYKQHRQAVVTTQ